MDSSFKNRWPWFVASLLIAAAAAVIVWLSLAQLSREVPEAPPQGEPPVTVHLFVAPEDVNHGPRFRFTFNSIDALTPLRASEDLDAVVEGSASYLEAWQRLMDWTSEQWEPGVPDPYPPPDATVILRDIRSGFTGGFCAQYCFVLTQAIQSMGGAARHVTIDGHEVIEGWIPNEGRWVMYDPTYRLQVFDDAGRALNALEIRRRVEEGRMDSLKTFGGHRLPEDFGVYLERFRDLAVWIRNDFVERPLNFTDFDRYRVWLEPRETMKLPAESLVTWFEEDLYPGIPIE
jgi:hypothetical protein